MNLHPAVVPEPPAPDVAGPPVGGAAAWLLVRLVLIAWLVTFFDGFDLNVIAFAAPYLVASFHLDTHSLADVFTSGIAGTLLGAVLFGVLGDRAGRRGAIIAAAVLFGVFTLALAFATRYGELLLLRFVGGLGLGGAIPLIWALGVEHAPRRYRATLVTVIMLGYGLGTAAAGPISITLIPRFGWQAVFLFGGIASLFTAVLLYCALPESPRFLAVRGAGSSAFRRTSAAVQGRVALDDTAAVAGVRGQFAQHLLPRDVGDRCCSRAWD